MVVKLNRRNSIYFVLILGTVIATLAVVNQKTSNIHLTQTANSKFVGISDDTFELQIADTLEERTKGLSGQDELPDRGGMIFIYETPVNACIWMKDMLMDIDILWFDENQNLIHQQLAVAPETFPKSFCPPANAKFVVEIPADKASQLGIKIGDKLKLL